MYACVHLLREITIMWCVYSLLSYLKWPKHILQCMIKKMTNMFVIFLL